MGPLISSDEIDLCPQDVMDATGATPVERAGKCPDPG